MWRICQSHGLLQYVKEPTRKQYLLDLVLGDISLTTRVLPCIADHGLVEATLSLKQSCLSTSTRRVWLFNKADWKRLKAAFEAVDWYDVFSGDVQACAEGFTSTVLRLSQQYIPYKTVSVEKASHPWINARCVQAVSAKRGAAGTAGAQDAAKRFFGRGKTKSFSTSTRRRRRLGACQPSY